MPEIIVDITDGVPVVSVKGIKGAACLGETHELEEALGLTAETRMTSEAMQRPEIKGPQIKVI